MAKKVKGRITSRLEIIREYMDDGEWHDRRAIIVHLAGYVPPVTALVLMEDLRARSARRNGHVDLPRQYEKSREELVRMGAYQVARRSLVSEIWRHPDRYEIDKKNNRVRRLFPENPKPSRDTIGGNRERHSTT